MPTTLKAAPTRFLVTELKTTTNPMIQNADCESAENTFDRVLLVSSDPEIRRQLNCVLKKRDIVVRNRAWHELTLTYLEVDVSVIILDACGDSGELDLCCQIRCGNPELPIIVLDKPTKNGKRISSFYAQTPFYLVKPCPEEAIFHVLDYVKRSKISSRKHFPFDYSDMTLEEVERRVLTDALRRNNGSRARAAQQLDICEKTVYNKIRQFRIDE